MSIESVSTMPLDIGEVLGDTFAVIGRMSVILANLAVLFVGVPAAINIAGVALTPLSPLFTVLSLIGGLASLAGIFMAYGAIFPVAMAALHGQPVPTDQVFKTATARFWPLVGLAILLGLAVMAGFVLLIVPGVILALAWCAAFPALVLEERGVFDSFRRSAALTRGKRWSIFLLFFIVGLVAFIVELVLLALFGAFHSLLSREPSLASTVISQLLGVITVPFGAVLSVALFNQLRGKAGHGAEAVAEVFA